MNLTLFKLHRVYLLIALLLVIPDTFYWYTLNDYTNLALSFNAITPFTGLTLVFFLVWIVDIWRTNEVAFTALLKNVFGELSLFDLGPRTATAIAIVDSKLLALANDQVIGWVTEHRSVSLQLLKRLSQRLRRANEVLSDLVFAGVPGRVAKAIIELGERFGTKKDDGLHVNHELTQEKLAQLVGASRETVNKSLADFELRGWIKLEPRAVVVLDLDRLNKRSK